MAGSIAGFAAGAAACAPGSLAGRVDDGRIPGSLGARFGGRGSLAGRLDPACMLGSLGRVAGCELAGGVAAGRIGVPWAGVFGRTALAGVTAGLDAVAGAVLVGLDLSAESGRCSRTPFAGVIVREVAPAVLTRGMGADGSRRTGVGAGDGGLLVVDAAGAAVTGGVVACGAEGAGAVATTGSGAAAGCGAGDDCAGDDCAGAGCCSAVAPAPACSSSPFSPLKSLEKIPIFDPSHHVMQSRAAHQCMPAATLPTV